MTATVRAEQAPEATWLAGAEAGTAAPKQLQLVQFWASWCHSCSGVTTDLSKIVADYPQTRYLAISTDEVAANAAGAAERMSGYAQGRAAVMHDSGGEWAQRYQVVTVPTVLVLDAQGRELARFMGHLNATDLSGVAAALEQAGVDAQGDQG
ncbi:MAG: TlpA family protein disulfide reductase [Lysobacterales bacterium]